MWLNDGALSLDVQGPKKKAILKRAISTYTHFKRDSPKKDMLEVLFSFFKESSKF